MYEELLQNWIDNAVKDPEVSAELERIKNYPEEIEDRFYRELDFGTAGLRGVLGAGTNRMNIYTVGKATQGFASFLNSKSNGTPSVAIAYDSRKNSLLFAEYSACVLGANGIHVYLYKELMPTPMLSYAVRALDCDGGIVITASHNPAQYNGYKVYGPNGYQITDEDAAAITGYIRETDIWEGIKYEELDPLLKKGVVEYISESVISDYYDEIYKCKVTDGDLSNISIVFSPLNGTGNIPVRHVLDHYGIGGLHIVKEQELPDENFTTCTFPNPELKEALELGLELCGKTEADILLATDPDCDRCGMAVRHNGEYVLLTGNQVGALMLAFICSVHPDKAKGGIAVKSIVSTELAGAIGQDYKVDLKNVLVGFKYIGEIVTQLEAEGRGDEFILGFEESCGYLTGTHSRDKDAVNASLVICDMVSYYKKQGKDLIDVLNELYSKYRFYLDKVDNYYFDGSEGSEKMKDIIALIDKTEKITAGGYNTVFNENYARSIRKENGRETRIDLPKSNVIRYGLDDGTIITVRPSGTEPKIKIYYSIKAENEVEAGKKYDALSIYLKEFLGIE